MHRVRARHVLGSSRWAAATERELRALSCGGERYDVAMERGNVCGGCGGIAATTLEESASDFARSLRFNAAVGSLTFGALCARDGAAALEFERLNDRPFGITSLLNGWQ